MHFRLAAEAHRIRLAYQYDPHFAVSVSQVDPLPHQLDAVYGRLLTQPCIRLMIADDPGAGKTIMAGLLIKELKLRGLIERTLIITPANLTDQWRRELHDKFGETFVRIDRAAVNASYGRNVWDENRQCITSIDFAARQDDVLKMMRDCRWDLVIVDEAHKMAAFRAFGGTIIEGKDAKGIWSIPRVPPDLRKLSDQVERRFGRVGQTCPRLTFDKGLTGQYQEVEFIGPGHPLFEGIVEHVLRDYGPALLRGATFYDADATEPQVLWLLKTGIEDGHLSEQPPEVLGVPGHLRQGHFRPKPEGIDPGLLPGVPGLVFQRRAGVYPTAMPTVCTPAGLWT